MTIDTSRADAKLKRVRNTVIGFAPIAAEEGAIVLRDALAKHLPKDTGFLTTHLRVGRAFNSNGYAKWYVRIHKSEFPKRFFYPILFLNYAPLGGKNLYYEIAKMVNGRIKAVSTLNFKRRIRSA